MWKLVEENMDNLIDYENTLDIIYSFTDYKGLAKDGIRIISKASVIIFLIMKVIKF